MPSSAIAFINSSMKEEMKQTRGKKVRYLIMTPAQQYQVEKSCQACMVMVASLIIVVGAYNSLNHPSTSVHICTQLPENWFGNCHYFTHAAKLLKIDCALDTCIENNWWCLAVHQSFILQLIWLVEFADVTSKPDYLKSSHISLLYHYTTISYSRKGWQDTNQNFELCYWSIFIEILYHALLYC